MLYLSLIQAAYLASRADRVSILLYVQRAQRFGPSRVLKPDRNFSFRGTSLHGELIIGELGRVRRLIAWLRPLCFSGQCGCAGQWR